MIIEKKIIYSLDNISLVVDFLFSLLNKYKIFTFNGDLGAGKTTLIQKLLQKAGVSDSIISPTYTYVSIYRNKQKIFYHFDLYRMTDIQNFYDMGFDELIYDDNSCSFIEWPEIVMPILTKEVCHVYLEYKDLNERIFKIICKD